MQKFRFNLERLLRVREHEERNWELKFGKAVSECVRIETDIARCGTEIERTILTRGSIENRENDFFTMEMYKRRMNSEILNLSAKLVEANKRRDSIRETFIEHSKNRKVLSKLKEKREREYYKEQLKIEFSEVDEINNSRAAGRTMV